MDWMIGWLNGWMVDWLDAWMFERLDGWLDAWMVICTNGRLIG